MVTFGLMKPFDCTLLALLVRHDMKGKPPPGESDASNDRCPAVLLATLLCDRVMAQSAATPFRRPVNAASLQLKDYHKIITRPMDLGTVYSWCILGEFDTLQDVVNDVELVFANAMRDNPKGHPVHDSAIEVRELFFKELDSRIKSWPRNRELHGCEVVSNWSHHALTSTSLDTLLEETCDEELESDIANVVHGLESLSSNNLTLYENTLWLLFIKFEDELLICLCFVQWHYFKTGFLIPKSAVISWSWVPR
jgi:Bromodomain